MAILSIAPIVEGHAEQEAVPILLRRICSEILGRVAVDVLRPIRVPRTKLIKAAELIRAVSLAELKLRNVAAERRLVLVMFDADEDAACDIAPRLLGQVRTARTDIDVTVVLPVSEFETWFVAAAESLHEYIDVSVRDIPTDPEASGAKKAWIQQRFRGRYTEAVGQPALTATMNLFQCRERSPSFDKLCRELAKRL